MIILSIVFQDNNHVTNCTQEKTNKDASVCYLALVLFYCPTILNQLYEIILPFMPIAILQILKY